MVNALRSLVSAVLRLIGLRRRNGADETRREMDRLNKLRASNVDLREHLKQDVTRLERLLRESQTKFERASHGQKRILKDEIEEAVKALESTEQRRQLLSKNVTYIDDAMEVLRRIVVAMQGLSDERIDLLTERLEEIRDSILDTDLAMQEMGGVVLLSGQPESDPTTSGVTAEHAERTSQQPEIQLSESAREALRRLEPNAEEA